MIIVIDYGMGNAASIVKMVAKVGGEARISKCPEDVLAADKLILPGVGAFDLGMSGLRQSGLAEALNHRVVREKCPILGICLGVQLFCHGSEEGKLSGLGWIDAEVRRFSIQANSTLRIPHMSWNTVAPTPQGESMFRAMDPRARYYFVHSYHLVCAQESDVAGYTIYGSRFAAAVVRHNIWGTQFHPEKSLSHGMRVMQNFIHHHPLSTS